jgi:ubiquinone/menaquinone biosynthesis C-methylase UbiE
VSDRETVKDRERALYSTGDYSFWSELFEPASHVLVEAAGIDAGDRVLDVAAGNGNTALAAARRGALVTAIDITPAQIERGRGRASAEQLSIEWREGDAEDLPFPDGSFDAVVSSFGVILEPRGESGAAEMCRVARRGGVVAATEWVSDGFVAAADALEARYAPERSDEHGERLTEEKAAARFKRYSTNVEVVRKVLPLRFASVEQFWRQVRERDPWALRLRAELSGEQWEQWAIEFRELTAESNSADDGSLRLDLEYMLLLATT